jgi:hypothetical protein
VRAAQPGGSQACARRICLPGTLPPPTTIHRVAPPLFCVPPSVVTPCSRSLNLASETVEPATSAPRNRFWTTALQRQGAMLPTHFSRSSRLETTFRSSTTTFRLRIATVESTLPTYLFDALPGDAEPVRFRTPLLVFSHGEAQRPKPVARRSTRQSELSIKPPLPFGQLTLGIEALGLIPAREAYRHDSPDLRSLPCGFAC